MVNSSTGGRMEVMAANKRLQRRLWGAAVITGAVFAGSAFLVLRDTAPAPAGPELLVGVSDMAFSTRTLAVEAGEVTLALANTDAVAHTFTVRALDVNIEAGGGEAARGTFTAVPGTYQYICTIPGHDNEGMRGVLTVSS